MLDKERFSKTFDLVLLGLLIAVICSFVFKDFLLLRKLYVYSDIGSDTLYSYWPYFMYASDLLRSSDWTGWSFQIGMGTSIFSIASYVFDPFHLVFFAAGRENLPYLLGYIAVLKIITAGLFTYLYLSTFKITRYAAIIGSLLYAFNGYLILWGQHYHFATFMVLVPLMLYAFERWLGSGRWVLFTCTIGFAALNDAYLLFMFTIFLILYALVRYGMANPFAWKPFLLFVTRTCGAYLLGMGLAGGLLLPAIHVLLDSPRLEATVHVPLFSLSGLDVYVSEILRFFSNDTQRYIDGYYGILNYYESPILYAGLIVGLLVPQVFGTLSRRSKWWVGGFFAALFCMLLLPYLSFVMNGFVKITYRWTFVEIVAMIFLATLSLGAIDRLGKLNRFLLVGTTLFLIALSVGAALYGRQLGWSESAVSNSLSRVLRLDLFLVAYAVLLWFFGTRFKLWAKRLLLLLVCIELTSLSTITVSHRDTVDAGYVQGHTGQYDGSREAVQQLHKQDPSFYRIDKTYMSAFYSDPLFQGYRGTTSYNSLNQPGYIEFLRGINYNFPLGTINYIASLNGRFKLQTLFGVKYLLSKAEGPVPSGFEKTQKVGDVIVYTNRNALPLGFTYDTYMTQSEFRKLSDSQMEDALLKSFIWNGEEPLLPGLRKIEAAQIKQPTETALAVSGEGLKSIGFRMDDNRFPASVALTPENGDPQLMIPMPSAQQSEGKSLSLKFSIKSDKELTGQVFWKKGTDHFSEPNSKTFLIKPGEHAYTVELGIVDADLLRFDLDPKPGTYLLSRFEAVRTDRTSEYDSDISKLKEQTLTISSYRDDLIQGSIDLPTSKLLFLSIPFDKGWQAEVDGKPAALEKVSMGFSGLPLKEGHHDIKLSYRPPMLDAGIVVTAISFVVLLYAAFRRRGKMRVVP